MREAKEELDLDLVISSLPGGLQEASSQLKLFVSGGEAACKDSVALLCAVREGEGGGSWSVAGRVAAAMDKERASLSLI